MEQIIEHGQAVVDATVDAEDLEPLPFELEHLQEYIPRERIITAREVIDYYQARFYIELPNKYYKTKVEAYSRETLLEIKTVIEEGSGDPYLIFLSGTTLARFTNIVWDQERDMPTDFKRNVIQFWKRFKERPRYVLIDFNLPHHHQTAKELEFEIGREGSWSYPYTPVVIEALITRMIRKNDEVYHCGDECDQDKQRITVHSTGDMVELYPVAENMIHKNRHGVPACLAIRRAP